MKRIINIVTAALLVAFLPGSCTNEDHIDTANPAGGDGKLTFVIPTTKKHVVSYSVPSVGDEDKLEHLDIFMFDGDAGTSTLEAIFRNDDISFGTSGSNKTATVDVTEKSGSKTFFLVGNAASISSALDAARYGETTMAEFQDMITDTQTSLPVPALIMTAKRTIADIESLQPDENKVSLKRMVARFDIDNDKDETNFTVKGIIIKSASLQGYIFDDAARTPATMETGNIPRIAFTGNDTDYQGPSEGVFYMYPTVLVNDGTEISLEGEIFGQTRLYSLQTATDVPIEPNKRYTIKARVVEEQKLVFELEVAEWEDDGEVEAEPNDHSVKMVNLELVPDTGTGTLTGKVLDITNATKESVLKFTAESFRKNGTKLVVTYVHGKNGIVPVTYNDPSPMLTYSAHYEQGYEVTVPALTHKVPVEVLVELVSKGDETKKETIRVVSLPKYSNTNLDPVLFGKVWWAPVNVGATEIGAEKITAHNGLLFQWGRNYGSEILYTGTYTDVIPGPLSYAEANSDENKNKFITSTAFSWLEPKDDGLWSGNNRQGPCPDGWRVPEWKELQLIAEAFEKNDGTAEYVDNRMEIKGDEAGKMLYFTRPGYRVYNSGKTSSYGRGLYWASKTEGEMVFGLDLAANNTIKLILHRRGYSFSVRCVLDE